ncbi:colicin D domain-containing protein [Caballeronia sp. LZ034LL]|uniref:colicin D domain-containing protein n=1 Tax=Caballeronia sp. LZ034LL TaxID=3038567 RepID=UPI002861F339|nr:colicin D domain-containing protein [Caballeronia sp. LZ034LL]MDR5834405.1 colicin D domain-containing protein [Caballeronia sp. LZ034LL]
MSFSKTQLDKKFKHAVDFGVTGKKNGTNLEVFQQAMKSHLDSSSTQVIQGKYRWADGVTHYFNPETKLNVMADQFGNFISGWKLSPRQEYDLLSLGNVF